MSLFDDSKERRHKELMGALGRIENAILFAIQEITASIKKDWHGESDGVTSTVTIRHADGTSTTREYKTDFLYSKKTARPFQIGDRVRIQGYELISGNIVELMNDGEVRILLDGERVILSVIVHEKDVVLIGGEA